MSHQGRVGEGTKGREQCKEEKKENSALENLEHILSIKRDEEPAKTQKKAVLEMLWRGYKANGDLLESRLKGGLGAGARL